MLREDVGDTDPFGTGALRRAVLDAWAASPARFREDANAEEDLALGGYRDRLVVELAQNAADAAARAGAPGRLRLTLRPADGEGPALLAAANTGAPLDAAGVESLSTLRASAKRGEAAGGVGRFGVGFSAVLAVSDEPAVISRSGAVRWSLAEARRLAGIAGQDAPGLADELRRREGHVPLLRLPLPAGGTPPEDYDTVVLLPLRDGAARDLAERLLAGVDDALLLTLPGLAEVVLETPEGTRTLTRHEESGTVVVTDSAATPTRWRVESAGGPLDAALLRDRPVEERLRPHWSVTWAVPVGPDGAPARPRTAPVVHAPTPTDEPLGLPALLIASLPLEPTRRHAAPGPLTEFLLARAAEAYVRLVREWTPVGPGTLDLVPGPLGRGDLDAALRREILAQLPRTPFLPAAAPEREDVPIALRPVEAELVEGANAATVRVLAEVFPSLIPGGLERRPELRALGVARLPLGEAVDRLAGAERPAHWWRELYDALSGTDPDALTGLPVPLADGRTVTGPRQVLLPLPGAEDELGVDPRRLARLGLKVAHPDAAHPLLEKLGALPATPRAVLTTPQVRAAVDESSLDEGPLPWDDEPGRMPAEELADIVLSLVRAANLAPGDEPWLAALALPDEDGEPCPAGEMVLPGSPLESVIREGELAACDAELVERWGEQPLTAVGVLATFGLVRATDVVLDPDELEPEDGSPPWAEDIGLLDAVDVWCEDVLDQLPETDVPPVATEVVAVRDLDLVDDDAWPRALAMLSRPPLRDALIQPVRVLLPDGSTRTVRPYTAWWLRDHPVLDGRRPVGMRAAGGDRLLAGLYDEAGADAEVPLPDDQVLRALGVRTSVAALLDEPGGPAELLARLADPDREVTPAQLHGIHAALAELDPEAVTLPDELRAVVDGGTRVVDAADALVADAPDLLPLTTGVPLLPVPPRLADDLADLLQVRRVSSALAAEVVSEGEYHQVPRAVRELLPDAPEGYWEHEELLVAGGTELDWRYTGGVLHAATVEGLAAGLAWAAGQWARRFEIAALLEDPDRTAELERDRWFE
ncbi:sacsin N-terminal ATP-binding-like domain-containing protein [Streptomyces capparidis]